jgi:pyruvate,water dikinase
LASYLDERHPSLLAAIAHLVQQAKQLGIPCAICGQAPVRFPELVAPLIRWGITAISVEPDAVEATAQAIRQTEQILRDSLPQTMSDR